MSKYEIEESFRPLVPGIVSHAPSRQQPILPWYRRQFCTIPSSKGVLMILLWNIIVAATYAVFVTGEVTFGVRHLAHFPTHGLKVLYIFLGLYAFVGLLQFLFYPLGGLLADNCCGRHRIMTLSIIKICCGYGIVFVPLVFLSYQFDTGKYKYPGHLVAIIPQGIAMGIAIILFVFGFTGFQANVVQFGLDQLLDSPSEELSAFLHWIVWTEYVGHLVIRMLALLAPCGRIFGIITAYSPVLFLVVLTTSLVISYYKRHWFHCEPRTRSPYGMVYRVLKFTAQHSRPLSRRSAFAYCDNEIPVRMDFAKQRFGGPFTTERVEDVKTFLRILVMLVAMGSTYVVHVCVLYIFPLYGLYIGPSKSLYRQGHHNYTCKYPQWILLESGNLSYILTVVLLPAYVLVILPRMRAWKCFPKILFRLGIGMALTLVAAMSMTVTLMGAHVHQHKTNSSSSEAPCLFNFSYFQPTPAMDNLNLPSWTLIFPNLLSAIAIPLTYITILEFISAQSPHTMKGLLLGVFYAVRGLFTITGCALVFPFANNLWLAREGRLFDCGLSYYTFNVVIGVVGLVVFCLTARWYQYRQREDRPYHHGYVEDCYQRYMSTQMPANVVSPEDEGRLELPGNTRVPDYGTV